MDDTSTQRLDKEEAQAAIRGQRRPGYTQMCLEGCASVRKSKCELIVAY